MYMTPEEVREDFDRKTRQRLHIRTYYERKVAETEQRASEALADLTRAQEELRLAVLRQQIYSD
jgi:hypothetical protein